MSPTAHGAGGVLLDHVTDDARQFLPASLASVRTVDDAVVWLEQQEADGTAVLFAGLRSSEDVVAVLVASEQLSSGVAQIYIGYLVEPSVQGRGIATELVRGFVTWVGSETSAASLVAGVESSHAASRSVLAKSGFLPVDVNDTSESYLKYECRLDR